MSDLLLQATPTKPHSDSSLNSVQNILYSIMSLTNKAQIETKLETLKAMITLNDVEKQIIKNIETSIDLNGRVDADYIKDKFSYYFNLSPERKIEFDKIEFAILDVQTNQAREKLTTELMTLAGEVQTSTSLDIKERFRELTENNILTAIKPTQIENGLQTKTDAYQSLIENRGEFTLGLPELELAAGKPAKGHIVSILAFTGSFKSTYALKLAYDNAKLGHNVLYLSLESTEQELINRVVLNHIAETAESRKDLITHHDLRDGKLLKSQIKHYNTKHNEVANLYGKNLMILDSLKFRYSTFTDMTTTLRNADERFKRETGKGLDMLVVDQLSLLKYTKASGKKATYDGAVMNDWVIYFAEQALNFLGENERQICYVNIAQVGREAYREASKKKNKGRYDASAASDSHEIERTSDTIITLYKDLDVKNTLLVHLPKARHGAGFDEPLQVEVYGEYFHIGPLNSFAGEQITAESFEKTDFDLSNLLKL